MPLPVPNAYFSHIKSDPFCRGLQAKFDAAHFDRDDWFNPPDGFVRDIVPQTTRNVDDVWYEFQKSQHIAWHTVKAVGKLARFLAAEDDGKLVRTQAFPDCIMYRTQLANTHGFDLEANLGEFVTHSSSLDQAMELGNVVLQLSAPYFERMGHHSYIPRNREVVRTDAVAALHEAGMIMANHFDVDPHQAHINHLRRLHEQPGLI